MTGPSARRRPTTHAVQASPIGGRAVTRRRGRRRADVVPLALAAFGGGALAVLILLGVLGWLGLAVLLAGAVAGGYALGRRHRPPPTSAPPCRHCASGQCGRCNGIGPCACPHNRGASPASVPVVTRAELDRQAGLWAAELARVSEICAADLAALAAERDDLARQVAGLRGDLAAARESAALAWDAAASASPPRPRANPEPPELAARLLADPLSGVRRLGPG